MPGIKIQTRKLLLHRGRASTLGDRGASVGEWNAPACQTGITQIRRIRQLPDKLTAD